MSLAGRPLLGALTFLLLSSSLLLCSGAAQAASYQFDNVIYQWPEEARRWVDGDHVNLSPDSDAGFAIRIFGSSARPEDLELWLVDRMDAVIEEDEELETRTPADSARQGGIDIMLKAQMVDGDFQMFFALPVGDRVELVMFDYWGRDMETQATVMLSEYLEPLIAQLQFVSEGADPLLGAPTPGPLDGIYYAQGMGYAIGGMELTHNFMMLSREGYFFEDVPEGIGTAAFDYTPVLRARPDDAGTYVVDGDVIRLSYADGAVEELAFTEDDGDLEIGSDNYFAVEAVEDGMSLAGYYSRFNYTSFGPGSGLSGGAFSSSSYTFTHDGRYSTDRASGAFANFENAAGDYQGGFSTGSDPDETVGRYAVQGGALVLTGPDGDTTVRSLVIVTDGMIAIDGSIYLRDDD